ncbi:hypothetical protein AKJ47_02240 [candidate division MSBL1 archaeon SCGC-AAA261G05]|uniref:Cas12f1-like TNB domain-containing protein n=1 Tax=candidate division MSBL1 archaeon SCGC-AAA261G05 TaxID=1698276 RepID=A0A133VAF7_9EURY|nr:hypothetical protein AKJ47_02240 [candidate division MSBL1 archaeon SCGC-AAA261G05]
MVEEVRTVKLNLLNLTERKSKLLSELLNVCKSAGDHLFKTAVYLEVFNKPESRFALQEVEYDHIKERFALHSQIIVDLCKDVFTACRNGGLNFFKYTIPYNVPRSSKLAETENGNPVISVATLDGRIGLPISQDGAWERFNEFLEDGYEFTSFRLKKEQDDWHILVPLRRESEVKGEFDSVLGVDVGSRTLASVTVLSKERVEEQLYFGRDVWEKQRDISIRRSELQSHADRGSSKARRKLRDLKNYESNFVKTRCYQVAHKIVKLAKQYNSVVAIEDLTGLKNARGHRKSDRRTKRMPYCTFRVALESVCKREGVPLIAVDPYHTSQSCPNCGSLGKRKQKGVIFECECGYRANADRVASLNIALRASETIHNSKRIFAQSPKGNVPVNGHDWRDWGSEIMSSHGYSPPERKPTTSIVGS